MSDLLNQKKLDKIIDSIIEDNNKSNEKNKLEKVKNMTKGGFGVIYQINYHGRDYVGKLIKKNKKVEKEESEIITEFRGPNIVKVNKVFEKIDGSDIYNLILMEKAPLKSLNYFINSLSNNNYFNLIFETPFEIIGNNLMRYFIFQLVQGLEILNRNNFCHFDIKPENILIFINFVLKWTDFGLLRDLKTIKSDEICVPGGTEGYFSPEYYSNNYNIDISQAIKHDFFALGATIYFMKYNKKMLKYFRDGDNIINSNIIIELLERIKDELNSEKSFEKEFIDFLCSLIQYDAKERPDFDKLYRNKWLNKYKKELTNIFEVNVNEENKILMELDKSEFLINKRKYLDEKLEKEKKNYRKNKFIFKEKK